MTTKKITIAVVLGAVAALAVSSPSAFAYKQCWGGWAYGNESAPSAQEAEVYQFTGDGSQSCSGSCGDVANCCANYQANSGNANGSQSFAQANGLIASACAGGQQVPGGKVTVYSYAQGQGCSNWTKTNAIFIGYCPTQTCTNLPYQNGTLFYPGGSSPCRPPARRLRPTVASAPKVKPRTMTATA